MKKYTTFSRKYKDQADCKNFGKQFDSMFDSMGEMFEGMGSMFNTMSEFNTTCKSSITEDENKTVIKKHGKTYVIDKDGNVTVNGKQMVEMSDKPYNPYNYTAADCKVEKVHENTPKFENIYWYIGLSFVMSCSLSILISCLICK
jgi:hypothetical protein